MIYPPFILLSALTCVATYMIHKGVFQLYKLYKNGACKDCRYSVPRTETDLDCCSPLFTENKVQSIRISKPCKDVRGSNYCDFKMGK